MPMNITSRTIFREQVMKPTLVLFRSETCLPCSQVTPLFRKMQKDPDLKEFDFVEVDSTNGRRVLAMENIHMFPTLCYYRKGNLIMTMKLTTYDQYKDFKRDVISKLSRSK